MNFKHSILAATVGAAIVSAASIDVAAKEKKACDRQPMSTYLWHGSLKDSTFIDRINFKNFDIVYLLDNQGWKSQEDFDATIDSIVATDGATVRLSKPDLFKQTIAAAHKEGTLAMMTTGNDMIFGALDDAKTKKMAKAIVKTIEEMSFDGVDVDWEIGIHNRMDRHANLMTELRASLDSLSEVTGKNYLLSTALSIKAQYPDSVRGQLNNAVDYINLMAYDMGGCLWRNYASHNTPMQDIKNSIDKLWYGIPRDKLHLGLASYGFIYKGIMPNEKTPEGKNLESYGRFVNYIDMLPHTFGYRAWREEYDPIEQVNYFIDDANRSFITMETPETVERKFEYAAEAGLGGTFWWEYAKDIVPDNNGGYKWKHILIPDHKQVGLMKQLSKKKRK